MSLAKRVVARFVSAHTDEKWVHGGERSLYVDAVWEMYKSSYAKIGLIVSSPSELLAEYDAWEMFLDGDKPVAFRVWKTTPFGLKAGLSGSDGTPAGKGLIKQALKTGTLRPGYYSEVSHAVERLTENSPVVCAVHVPRVLKKPVTPESDGVHYTRQIKGVGAITKKMVGRPRGVPSGPGTSCPLPEHPGELLTVQEAPRAASRVAEMMDLAEHYGDQLDVEDGS